MASDRLLVQIASYNTNLQAERGVPQDLVDWLSPTLQVSTFLAANPRAPDIVAVGFQELLPLHLGLSGLSKTVIEHRNLLILSQIEEHAPNKEKYSLIAKVVNVGVALLVYGRDDGVARRARDVQTQWTGCGPAYMGNKGAVGVRFRVEDEDGGVGEIYTFVCAHLTAHANKLAQRVANYHHIVGTLLFPPVSEDANEPTTIYSTSHLFFFGDLNFRLALPPSQTFDLERSLSTDVERRKFAEYDQLILERDIKHSSFHALREGEFWRFKCSYKYRLGAVDHYDHKRMPAWTDRVMYASYADSPDKPEESEITTILYTSIPAYITSDHKPIVSLHLLPPSPPSRSGTPPLIRLPATYTPRPDPNADLKKYIGRTLDRLIGYCWWLLTALGSGSVIFGLSPFIIGLSLWKWWKAKPSNPRTVG